MKFCIFPERVLPVYRLSGLSLRAAAFVVELAVQEFGGWQRSVGRLKTLPLLEALRLTLPRLRRNATHQDLHEDFGIGKTTAWGYHQQMAAFRRARRR